jgi:hypothetical protein
MPGVLEYTKQHGAGLECGSSGKAPTLQGQSPEFKTHSHQKQTHSPTE